MGSFDSSRDSTSQHNGVTFIDLTTEDAEASSSSSNVLLSDEESQSGSETEVNEDDTGDDDDDDGATKVEGSIHRLCIEKLKKVIPNKKSATEEEMIDVLVYNFNEKKKTTGNFELEHTSEQNSDLLCQVLPRNNFHVRLYVSQRRGSVPPILKWYGCGRKCGPIHLAWFFYRQKEIFAFTTNQGYRLVHDYSEFDFPNKISARLCTDKGFKVRRKRLLVGQDWEESKVTKNSERPSASDLPSVYSTFTSELRHNASIREVTRLSNLPIHVKFKTCSVRFVCKLQIMDLPKILNHLSKIAKGLPTFTHVPPRNSEEPQDGTDSQNSVEGSVPEISNSVYDSFLVPVKNEELRNELDLKVASKFRQAVISKDFREFPFDLGYKHHKDLAMATKVELVRKLKQRRAPVRLSTSPSLHEILPYLSDYAVSSSDVFFAKRVLKEYVQIRFTLSTNRSKDDSLLSFLEGELFYNNKIYWHSRNLWFEPMDSYVVTADKMFIGFLQQHYLQTEARNHLTIGFPTPQRGQHDCVQKYTEKYKGLGGYYLPSFTRRPILFDLLYADNDGKIWIYYIAYNFMAHTPNLCARTNNCLEAIKAACEDQNGAFRSFYDRLDAQRRSRLGESFEIFQSRLKESRIVYALAESISAQATGSCSLTLRQEKDRKVKITQEVLQDALRHLQNEELQTDLASVVHRSLMSEGYIDNNDMVTTKFLYCAENQFIVTGMENQTTRAAVHKVLTRFQSGFKSLRARFELRDIAKKALYSTKFFVQDISSHDA